MIFFLRISAIHAILEAYCDNISLAAGYSNCMKSSLFFMQVSYIAYSLENSINS